MILPGLGGGRFGEPRTCDLDRGFNAVKLLNVNWDADSDQDLIVTATKKFDKAVVVFLNDGKAHFTHAPKSPVDAYSWTTRS